jgi:hypothetical protein
VADSAYPEMSLPFLTVGRSQCLLSITKENVHGTL